MVSVVIFCPPLSQYPKPPKDMSKCKLVKCPDCKQKMWLSEKKEKIINNIKTWDENSLLACYECFKKVVMANPEIMRDHVKIDI